MCFVCPSRLTSATVANLPEDTVVATSVIERAAALAAAHLETFDLSYGVVASNIELDLLYRQTPCTFSAAMQKAAPFLSEDFVDVVLRHKDILDRMINWKRDELLGHYLLRRGEDLCERPQYLFLRTALAMHGTDMDAVMQTYELLSQLHSDYKEATVAACLEPWHPEIIGFIEGIRQQAFDQNAGTAARRTVLVNDLFMERVRNDEDWTLFCPSEAPTLVKLSGRNFQEEYLDLEARSPGQGKVKARQVWNTIIDSLLLTGGPSVLFKDSINYKSNEQHLGTICQANPHTDTVQWASLFATAVCPAAFIVLPNYVTKDGTFDFPTLEYVIRQVVFNMNRLLARTVAPTEEAETSAYRSKAIKIGVQGFAETLSLMDIEYGSIASRCLNMEIAETIYYVAVDESANLTSLFGIYPDFKNSPVSRGLLQFDLWEKIPAGNRFDWSALRQKAMRGTCNSVMVAYGSETNISHFTGCTAAFHPYFSLIGGEGHSAFVPAVNKLLVRMLDNDGLWSDSMRDKIVAAGGACAIYHF
ncbi:hypothetical protein H1R20_g11888, partial [Candolleomyces eurysporus]